jgi:hypothetical protein
MRYKVLFPNGTGIDQNTRLTRKGVPVLITNETELAKFIKLHWCNWSKSQSFSSWAGELNHSGEYEGKFTKFDAIDNLHSNYHLELNGKTINLYDFIIKYTNVGLPK